MFLFAYTGVGLDGHTIKNVQTMSLIAKKTQQ